MTRVWLWVTCGLLALLGVGAYLFWRSRGDRAQADLVQARFGESIAKRLIKEDKRQLDSMLRSVGRDETKIAKVSARIQRRKAALKERLERAGVDEDEVMDRLRRIHL